MRRTVLMLVEINTVSDLPENIEFANRENERGSPFKLRKELVVRRHPARQIVPIRGKQIFHAKICLGIVQSVIDRLEELAPDVGLFQIEDVRLALQNPLKTGPCSVSHFRK